MLKALRVVLEFHWGYSIKHPFFSASQPAFRLPTPTSLIGALAYTVALQRRGVELYTENGRLYSYAARILDDVLWVTYRLINIDPRCIVETRDISRVLIAPYVRSDNVYPGSSYIWAVQTHGKIYAPSLGLDVVYVVRDRVADDLARYSWGISRIGTKESIVSVKSVEVKNVEIVDVSDIETSYCFPRKLADPLNGMYLETRLPCIEKEWFAMGVVRDPTVFIEDFVIPVDVIKVRVKDEGRVFRIDGVGMVIASRKVVGHG